MTPEGLIVRASRHDPKQTMDRLAAAVTARGAAVVARIDHAAAAAAVGLALPPTEVLVFGNPRAGTPLMQAAQTIGIDLPLKALVWRDASGATYVGYNDPRWLARRHGAEGGNEATLKAMADFLAALAEEAATQGGETGACWWRRLPQSLRRRAPPLRLDSNGKSRRVAGR